MIRRFGLAAAVRWGTLACVMSLALCALSGNFFVLSFARLLAGSPRRPDSSAAARWRRRSRRSRPERANFLLSLFYAGPGIGILASGLIAPFVLQAFRPRLVVDRVVGDDAAGGRHDHSAVAGAAGRRWRRYRQRRHRPNSRSRPVLVYLAGYFLFGAGYIAYMTFMIAYVRDSGGGAAAQSAFWSLIGLSPPS